MGKPTGFIEFKRHDLHDRDPETRVKDYEPIHTPVSETSRRKNGGRCMDCGVPFCQAGIVFDGKRIGCPLHNLIPEWNEYLWEGNYGMALSRLLKTAPFPEFTGRVCPALCESSCNCGLIGESVTVKDNECAIIDYAFANDMMRPNPPAHRSDYSVAVVGSGPAGLAAAYYLNHRGHNVTVFEREALPGGLLTYGIAPVKLPQSVVARRIRLMEQEGIRFVTGCDIGSGPELDALKAYDMVIFACGALKPRELRWEEMPESGVYYAMDFLKPANEAVISGSESELSADGKHVVVIGAGDSASDCVAMAMRQGCASLEQLVRRPAGDYTGKPDYAHEESEAVYKRDIRRFSCKAEKLVMDAEGKLTGVVVTGGETIPCDMLIIASGFAGCEDYSLQAKEKIEAAGIPVLTAGDMASGASLVVLAIASGKEAAAEADRRLMGYTNIL